jgi:hypothetical protein
MTTFKYQITWHSLFQEPQVFITNNIDTMKMLKFEGKNQQYKVESEEGIFKAGYTNFITILDNNGEIWVK